MIRYRDKCDEVSTSLKQKARMLAEFVAENMSGLTQEKDCSLPSVNLHLTDLMVNNMNHYYGSNCRLLLNFINETQNISIPALTS